MNNDVSDRAKLPNQMQIQLPCIWIRRSAFCPNNREKLHAHSLDISSILPNPALLNFQLI